MLWNHLSYLDNGRKTKLKRQCVTKAPDEHKDLTKNLIRYRLESVYFDGRRGGENEEKISFIVAELPAELKDNKNKEVN